jgi:putative cell wall-binding protein
MRQKNYRIRRLAVAAVGAVTAVSGIAVLGVGPAQAANSTTTVVAATPTTLRASVPNQPAANEAITIQATSTWVMNDTITLTVNDSANTHPVAFSGTPTVTPANVPGSTLPTVTSVVAANVLTITFTNGGTASATQPILVSGIAYTTTGADVSGPVTVTPVYTGTGTAGGVISSASASNATIVGTPTIGLTAATTPNVGAGLNNQAAGNLSFSLTGLNTGWFAGDQFTVRVAPNTGPNCGGTLASPIGIGFSSAPSVSATVGTGQTTTPTFSAVGLTQSAGPCTGTAFFDQAIVTLTNSGTITGTGTPPVTITFSGISYNVTAAVPLGNVSVTGLYNGAIVAGPSTTGATAGPSNATVGKVSVSANQPPVGLAASGSDQPISNVVITEAQPGAVPIGTVCVQLSGTSGTFNTTTTAPTVTASGGGAVVGAPTVNTAGTLLQFNVTTASSTTAATYTVGNLNVNSPATGGPDVAAVSDGASSTCTGGAPLASSLTLYNTFIVNRIFGQTADGTAAAELAQAFPSGCPASHNVVLATDQNFPDALSASYLASKLGTGVLLTPTNALAAETVTALRVAGINHVYIVGGPLAVAENVVAALGQEPVYQCGGITPVTNTSGQVFQTVTQVFGQTQYDTAQTVAQYFGSTVGLGSFNGAYPTSITGTSAYNTTSGLSGTLAPVTTGTPTAILATGQTFPDAMAASGMSYAQQWPILLTQQASLSPQASAAITNLGIKQVIVMGGPIAISDTVVTQLETLGVSVLRIAGTDYTDTAQLLGQFELSSNVLNWAAGHSYDILVARGDFFADALAGSALSGLNQSPIVLTLNPNVLGSGIPALFTFEHGLSPSNQVDSITVLGGPIAVAPATVNQILASIPG